MTISLRFNGERVNYTLLPYESYIILVGLYPERQSASVKHLCNAA